MSASFQQEIPKARVNITLDVDTGGAQNKVELPLHLLMVGDYSNGKETAPILEREKVNINKHNFNQVLGDLAPEVAIDVKDCLRNNGEETNVNLQFKNINDFSPDAIAQNVPQLKKLMAMRNLLKELRANLIDNKKFRKALDALVREQKEIEQVRQQIPGAIEV